MDTDVDTFLPKVYDAPDLDTFLVAVYTVVDTLYQTEIAPYLPLRPGPAPQMHDSEVLTLVLIGQWRGSSERDLLRWATRHLADAFPVLLSQSAFNRRVRRFGPLCVRLLLALADALGVADTPYQIADTTPVPLARQCRGRRHRLFADEAAVGRGGSDRSYYYGCSLLLVVAADGPITGFVLGPASTQDRWLLDAALSWRRDPAGPVWGVADIPRAHRRGGGGYVGPTGPRWYPDSVGRPARCPYVADTGFRGAGWQPHWAADTGADVVTAPRHDAGARRQFSGWRQMIETVNGVLADTFHLAFPRAKTMWGVVTRVAAKCAAFNLGIWVNRHFGRNALALDTLFPG